jgi:hypothetical protein
MEEQLGEDAVAQVQMSWLLEVGVCGSGGAAYKLNRGSPHHLQVKGSFIWC